MCVNTYENKTERLWLCDFDCAVDKVEFKTHGAPKRGGQCM